MYSAMLKCRMMEEKARDWNTEVIYNLTIGHEAIVVGATIDLRPEDTIAASHRNFAARVVMGTSLKYLLKDSAANNSDKSRASILSCRFALPAPLIGRLSRRSIQPRHWSGSIS